MWTGVLALPIGALQAQAVVQGIDGVAGLIGKAGAAAGKVLSQYGEARKKVAEGQRELNNQNGNPTVSGATPNPGGSVPQYIFQGPPGVTVPPGSPNPQMGQPGVYV
ncbi:MAG: hypothetical protein LBJ77_00185, partial [Holosporales bacterium]|nr:hypothetical protein [Holosporales bacterium]